MESSISIVFPEVKSTILNRYFDSKGNLKNPYDHKPSKPASCPKPRIEGECNSLDRITAELKKEDLKNTLAESPNATNIKTMTDRHLGMRFGDHGLVATNGVAAIFQSGVIDSSKTEFTIANYPGKETLCAELNQDIYLALKRLALVVKDDYRSYITMTFDKSNQLITMTAESEDGSFIGKETVHAWIHKDGQVNLDPERLLQLLGVWPINLYLPEDPDRPVVLAPTYNALFAIVLGIVKVKEYKQSIAA
jgi:hypothetical protein